MFKKYQHIHFVGIGGIGMSGIAQVLLTLGYDVSGSDIKKSATTNELVRRGAKIFIGHKEKNVDGANVVVISSAVKSDNPEVAAAKSMGLPVVPRAEMLAELMRMKYGIAIAGTHGKTTTTSLVATVLTSAGLDPTIVIGGKVNSFKTNARLGRGEFLVAEADESDRSFIKLSPTIAVITNIDPEHMENYRDFDHVKETYVSFANKVPFYGAVVACIDHPEVAKLLSKIERRVVTYGVTGGDYTAKNVEQNGLNLEFDVYKAGKKLGRVKFASAGRHNVLNALATIAVADELEIPFKKISAGLAKFKGIERRFQILAGKKNAPMVVTDYAHHPKEIEAVFSAAREGWPMQRIVCVMQPHRFTRLTSLFDDFAKALSLADSAFVLPVYAAGEAAIAGASSERLVETAKNCGACVEFASSQDELFKMLKGSVSEPDILLFLGAGDIWKTAADYAKRFVKNR